MSRRPLLTRGALPLGSAGAANPDSLGTSFGDTFVAIMDGGVAPASASTVMTSFEFNAYCYASTSVVFFACTRSADSVTITSVGPSFALNAGWVALNGTGALTMSAGHLLGVWFNNQWMNLNGGNGYDETTLYTSNGSPLTTPAVGVQYTSLGNAGGWRTAFRASRP